MRTVVFCLSVCVFVHINNSKLYIGSESCFNTRSDLPVTQSSLKTIWISGSQIENYFMVFGSACS